MKDIFCDVADMYRENGIPVRTIRGTRIFKAKENYRKYDFLFVLCTYTEIYHVNPACLTEKENQMCNLIE